MVCAEEGSKTKQKSKKEAKRGKQKKKQARYRSGKNHFPVGNQRLRRAERWEYIPTVSSEVGEIQLSKYIPISGYFWWAYRTYRRVGYQYRGRTEPYQSAWQVLRPYRTVPKTSVGRLSSKYRAKKNGILWVRPENPAERTLAFFTTAFHQRSSRKFHTTRRPPRLRGLRVADSTAPDLSGSGRVNMLTRPVAAARAAVATGASG